TGVAVSTSVTATFSEAMSAASITSATVTLKNSSNVVVPATVGYSGSIATLTPSGPLAYSTTYTATVAGGASGVADRAGNPLASDLVWSFTTGPDPSGCPCSLWGPAATPDPLHNGPAALELGMKFQSDSS